MLSRNLDQVTGVDCTLHTPSHTGLSCSMIEERPPKVGSGSRRRPPMYLTMRGKYFEVSFVKFHRLIRRS